MSILFLTPKHQNLSLHLALYLALPPVWSSTLLKYQTSAQNNPPVNTYYVTECLQ